jgi:hypothetical protein
MDYKTDSELINPGLHRNIVCMENVGSNETTKRSLIFCLPLHSVNTVRFLWTMCPSALKAWFFFPLNPTFLYFTSVFTIDHTLFSRNPVFHQRAVQYSSWATFFFFLEHVYNRSTGHFNPSYK